MSSLWTMSPFIAVDRRGVEPRFPGCKPGVFPLDEQPRCFLSEHPSLPSTLASIQVSYRWTSSPYFPRGPSGIRTRPSSVPRRCAAKNTYRPRMIPDGVEPSLSWLSPRRLCRWTTGSFVSDRSESRTHRITRLSTSSLYQFAYPAVAARLPLARQVAGSGIAPDGPGL